MYFEVDNIKKHIPMLTVAVALTSMAFFFGDLKRHLVNMDNELDSIKDSVINVQDRIEQKADKADVRDQRERLELNSSRITSQSYRSNGLDARIKRLEK